MWFALDESKPLFMFAGIWTTWHSTCGSKKNPDEGEHELCGFLTRDPNGVVAPIRPKAMRAIVNNREEMDIWLRAMGEAAALQRPLPDAALRNVARGEREDGAQLAPVETRRGAQ